MLLSYHYHFWERQPWRPHEQALLQFFRELHKVGDLFIYFYIYNHMTDSFLLAEVMEISSTCLIPHGTTDQVSSLQRPLEVCLCLYVTC